MSTTRNNHYVPEWYQKGFWEPDETTLAYLNLTPATFKRSDGSIGYKRALNPAPPSRAFVQRDLYSTFFGAAVNDEIERKLFGDIDTRGAAAVRAFAEGDPAACHRNFESLFEYIDIQKLRTPKGLAWLGAQYPSLSQNELMMEMQAIRMMHCTIWTEGVREIVSAEESGIKFILSDHPVTVFNPGAPPQTKGCVFPLEPGIELKGTQTIFPLDRDHCLILTNLEYAQDQSVDPLSKRTFARRFRTSMVRTDAFIRSRKLTTEEVQAVNLVIRTRAHQFVAAGNKDWLPDSVTDVATWRGLGQILLPPSGELFGFGGEMYVKYENGGVHFQDAFGRTEKEREFLKKPPIKGPLKSRNPCGCGSDKAYVECCKPRPVHLRPAWDVRSIRERNMALLRGIENILELRPDQDWTEVRKSITDEKISKIYSVYEALWPLETDLLGLLPKPDGTARAVYTGMLDARKITETGLGASLLFGELLIQHPFTNPRTVNDKFNPIKNPQAYRHEVLKSVLFFMQVMPLVEAGIVNLFPDPWDFDYHLRKQTIQLAEERWRFLRPLMEEDDSGLRDLASEEFKRTLLHLSEDGQRAVFKRYSPELSSEEIEMMLEGIDGLKEEDPFAIMQEGAHLDGKDSGQLSTFKLAPNFEMAMYVAQATGATIVTDHPMRWKELLFTILLRDGDAAHHLSGLGEMISQSHFSIAQHYGEILQWWCEDRPQPHVPVFRDAYRYLGRVDANGAKPNFEQRLAAQFSRAHRAYETEIRKADLIRREARIQCAFPNGGIYDSTITRLLLMSSSEHHVQSVPMAFFVDTKSTETAKSVIG
ncbi:DUF4238 domain-containing protein [Maricaulis sp.]|uniref:DUF4238 domain-containing protein n=1 Tax=Maricaulis sp. TaxID=1486257 RepID=UPI000C3D8616|nr:DUF4238 domain-containing protein [Maricaulis sp.]MAC89080.1 hypothetical protein [Maricaulis sp.]